MHRNVIILFTVFAIAAVMAVPAFADVTTDAKTWFEQRFNAKKAAVEAAVEEGRISPERGQQLQEHFDQMYKFHEENGFVCPMGNQGMGRGNGVCPYSNQGMGAGGGFGRQGMGPGGMGFGNGASRQGAL